MLQDYQVFKDNTPTEITNQYFQQCVDEEKVYIVIKTKRKFARIEYDFITLDNNKQLIRDLSACTIEDKIRAYSLKYASEHHLPTSRLPKTIVGKVGAFEFYIEDVEKVGNDISEIIGDAVNSDCIKYTTLEETLETVDPDIIVALTGVSAKDL